MIEDLKLNCHVCGKQLLVDKCLVHIKRTIIYCKCDELIKTYRNCKFNFF